MKFFAGTLFVLSIAPAVASVTKVAGDRTMTKVVKMLQEMLDKSQKDGEKDRDLYTNFKCYCDNNEAEKTQSIKELIKEIQMIENDIEKIQAHSGELSTECAKLKEDIADNEAARASAEDTRKKEAEDFKAEEADLTEALDAMGQAIETLAAVGADQTQGSSADHDRFMGKKSLLSIKANVKKVVSGVSRLLNPKEKRTLNAFLQAPFTGTYTSQSGEIVGILKNMRDTFKDNLGSIRATEKAAIEAHEKFMKIKKEEHATMTESYDTKQGMLGANDAELADQRDLLDSAKKALASDQDFLAKLIPMCEEKAKEFEKRNMLRTQEEAAISKAISILNSDEAFEAFGKTSATKSGSTGPAFIQIQQHDHQGAARKKLIRFLEGISRKQKSLKIARILVLIEAENPFETVLTEIGKMIALIDEEQKADQAQFDWCDSERSDSETKKTEAEDQILTLEDEIQKLDDSINNEETGFKAVIKQEQENLKINLESQSSETKDRAQENMLYQQSIKNCVGAQDLLAKAIKVLDEYYSQFNKPEEFLQREDPAPPETWEGEEEQGGYAGQRDAGSDVIEMLKFIASETNKEETDAHKAEEEAQHEFEDSMKELKDDQAKLIKSIADLEVDLADAEKTLGEKKVDLEETQARLKTVEEYLLKIKPGCDFITTNMDARTENRKKEKEGLEKAVGLIKETPAYKAAVAAAEQEALGECKDICNEAGKEHAKCKACLAGVSVPGYCAGHAGTEGC